MSAAPEPGAAPEGREAAAAVLGVVAALARELGGARAEPTLDSRIDRDLGIDSLGRVELMLRLEEALGAAPPDEALQAETVRDLVRLVARAAPGPGDEAAAAAAPAAPPAAGSGAGAPVRARTLVEALEHHAARTPDRVHVHLYETDTPQPITYGALLEGALRRAAGLQALGVGPGETVALMLPTGRAYLECFLGALALGAIAVPLYPPARVSQLEEHLRRHGRILASSGARVLVTLPEARRLARVLRAAAPALERVVAPEAVAADPAGLRRPAPDGSAVAFLQYTSGSTGDPKGVVLTHANLLANIRAMGEAVGASPDDCFVSWLPLYHDMGLIGAWLGSLYHGAPLVLMPPLRFMARPRRWLEAISRHRGTLSASPNFGYALCATRLRERDLEGLDLSSWRCAFNGAEPVSPATVERFVARMRPYGFRPEAMMPVYGLAESSVGLCFPPPGRGVRVDAVRRETFEREHVAAPAAPDEPGALRFVGCGFPLPGHQVRIVGAEGRELPERHEGRIQFRGPSATSGYWRNPEATRALFDGEWLETGDLGYLADGELFVTGRVKDLIIRAGRNLYPQEIEDAVQALEGVRPGGVAAFAAPDPEGGGERLVVMAETTLREPQARAGLEARIREAVAALGELPPEEVVLVPPHAVPKTSSGKVRRGAARAMHLEGRVPASGAPRRARLAWMRAAAALRLAARRLDAAGGWAWGAWAWALFGLFAAALWPAVALVPGRAGRGRWAALRAAGRLYALLAGIPLRVRGLEHLPEGGRCVIAANHQSYADAFVLVTALPLPLRFVAKAELRRNPFARLFLDRLGTEYVERFRRARAAADARRIAARAGEGAGALVFFPEGTFYPQPGLLPFRTGAFLAAVEAGLPVVPVAIRGTRRLLRSGTWRPRRGPVTVTVLPPVHPEGHGLEAAVRLRERVRAVLAAHVGEPDLAPRASLAPSVYSRRE